MKIFRILILLLLTGCDEASYSRSDASIELEDQLKRNEYKFVNFSELQGDKWTKVCFLGPYNTQSSNALGFEWDITKHTDVLASDGHNVIIFATDSKVINFIIHGRGYGDFWRLTGQCFPRENSKFYKDQKSGAWYAK